MPTPRLAVCQFSTPFDGEVAYFEIGLHRLTHPRPRGWEVVERRLGTGTAEQRARQVLEGRPNAIVLHVYRNCVVDALGLARELAAIAPEIPLLWCGWSAHAPYVQAVAEATIPLLHPRMMLVCGEIEASLPAVLEAIRSGIDEPERLVERSGSLTFFDPGAKTWRGEGRFDRVADLTQLAAVWADGEPMEAHAGGAGWIELSRGCRYACGFCVACSMGDGDVRSHSPGRIRQEIEAASRRGVKLFGLLAAAVNYELESLRAAAGALGGAAAGERRVAGTVHARFASDERLELMSAMKWETMIVGLQTTTAEAQRLMRRAEQRETFAAAIERLAALCVPEVELILGLPGDSAAGFEQTVRFALTLPASVSIYRLRLDPWASFMMNREALGLNADFGHEGRVTSTPSFTADEIDAAERWIRELPRGAWAHRARQVVLDGVPLRRERG